jgi:O-antigen/teichoic acid export membrane protein
VVVRGAALGLNFVVSVILARTIGPRGYGLYAFALSMTALLAIPSTAALSTLVVREVAAGVARKRDDLVAGVTRWSDRRGLALALSAVLVALLVGLVLHARLTSEGRLTFTIALALVPLSALIAIRAATLRGLHHVVAGQAPEQIVVPAVLLAALGIVFATGHGGAVDSVLAIALYVTAALAALTVSAVMLARWRPAGVRSAEPRYDARAWRAAVVPLLFVSGFAYANRELGLLLVGSIAGPTDAGIYRVAVRGATLVTFALGGVNAAVAPRLARLHAMGDVAALRRMLRLAALASLAWALPVAALLIGFSTWILTTIFGADYAVAATSLTILCLGQLVNAATGPVGLLLNMTGRERVTARGHAVALAVGLIAGLILIPRWGVAGAAAASALSMVTWNVTFAVIVARSLGITDRRRARTGGGA